MNTYFDDGHVERLNVYHRPTPADPRHISGIITSIAAEYVRGHHVESHDMTSGTDTLNATTYFNDHFDDHHFELEDNHVGHEICPKLSH